MKTARSTSLAQVAALVALSSLCALGARAEEERRPPQRSAPARQQPQRQAPQRQAPQRQAPQTQQRPPQQQRAPQQQYRAPSAPARAQAPAQNENRFNQPARPAPQQQAQRPQQSPAQRPGAAPSRPAYSLPEGHAQVGAGGRAQPLNPAESHQVLSQVNGARAGMHGINAAPLPHGNVSVRAGGALHIEAAGGRSYGVRANGTMQSYSSPQRSATFRENGQIASMRTSSGLRISRSPGGERVIVRAQPNGSLVVSNGPHYGYVQRQVVYGHQAYVQRTYVVNGAVYTRAYRPYYYGGVVMNVYTPSYYYNPGYYRWAYSPWRRPVEYNWGWRERPWYGYYGGYFTPMAVYPTPAYWLGDYILAAELQESYDARLNAQAQAQADADADAEAQDQAQQASPITPEVRAAIAEEVQRQLAEEQSAASSYQPPPAPPSGEAAVEVQPGAAAPAAAQPPAETPVFLQTPGRVFVVASSLDVVVDQETCSLSAGDVLRLDTVPPPGEVTAPVRVLSSKAQDCTAGATATLSVDDLQEMYNNLHEKVDSGLGDLKTAQGTGGIPAAPAGTIDTTPGPGAAVPPPADNSAALLAQTQRDADAAEAELDAEVKNPPADQGTQN